METIYAAILATVVTGHLAFAFWVGWYSSTHHRDDLLLMMIACVYLASALGMWVGFFLWFKNQYRRGGGE
jgi:hypothetical protein